jgi:hypothetical protein
LGRIGSRFDDAIVTAAMSFKEKIEVAPLDGVKVREQVSKGGGGPFTEASFLNDPNTGGFKTTMKIESENFNFHGNFD